jgi:hypothetical protein
MSRLKIWQTDKKNKNIENKSFYQAFKNQSTSKTDALFFFLIQPTFFVFVFHDSILNEA